MMVAYALRHGKQEIPHGSVRRRMEVHPRPSARARERRTSQIARPEGDTRGRLLRPEEWLPLAVVAARLPALEDGLDGLITNDKFCFTRRSRLKLRSKRRGYPSRNGVRRGGIDETELDRSTRDGRSRRRRPSLGPSLCAPPPLGGNEANHDEGGGA